MSKSFKAGRALVLFDIDGTLLRGAGVHHKQALIDGIQKVTGLATHLDGIPTSGMLDRDLIAAMLTAAGHPASQIEAAMQKLMDECQSAFSACCTSDLTSMICPGARELLEQLRERGAVLGLVTGNLSGIGWRKMELAGLRPYFSVGAFAEDGATRTELARVGLDRAVAWHLVPRNPRTSLIGDHPNDIEAARANGFQAVAVTTGLISRDALAAAEPDILVPSLDQLDIGMLF
jgi:phosphoglycolate phosphatase